MSDIVITSDTHAFHDNIINYCNRPFVDVNEMNITMAKNINDALPSGGQLIHCGDWAFRGVKEAELFRGMLRYNVRVTLIVGNHDIKKLKDPNFRKLFDSIYDLWDVKLNGQPFVFCHYAMKVWRNSHHGSYHLYGHSHGSLRDDPTSRSFDCGVDCHNFKPFTLDEVHAIMQKKQWQPVDHHGER